MTSEIKTRVTPLQELELPTSSGQDCLVTIYCSDGGQLGRRFPLGAHTVRLGRGSENNIVLENDAVSRKHAMIAQDDGHYIVTDLESTNGTYVNDEMVRRYQLRRGDQIKIGDTIFKFLSGQDLESQYHETIYRMTIIDGLTGIHNKRYLMEALERELSRSRRHDRPLSFVMFDLDHFKKVNDTFGHLAGDFVLKEVAQLLARHTRPDDCLARFGGEEFAILLPETQQEGAMRFAEKIRTLVMNQIVEFESERISVTISCGVAELKPDWDANRFIRVTDEQLYRAKHSGRNRVHAP